VLEAAPDEEDRMARCKKILAALSLQVAAVNPLVAGSFAANAALGDRKRLLPER
jgi:hypothetical protein